MNLRSLPQKRQSSAYACVQCAMRFSKAAMWSTLMSAARALFLPPLNHTPSLDGQQACPSAVLPVTFQRSMRALMGKWERFEVPRVKSLNDITKGSTSWQSTKSVSHSQSQRVLPHVATQSVSKRSAAVPSVQVPQPSPAVAFCKVQPSARAQTCLPVRQTSSTATNTTLISYLTAMLRWSLACGVFRAFNPHTLPHKGSVYVQ